MLKKQKDICVKETSWKERIRGKGKREVEGGIEKKMMKEKKEKKKKRKKKKKKRKKKKKKKKKKKRARRKKLNVKSEMVGSYLVSVAGSFREEGSCVP